MDITSYTAMDPNVAGFLGTTVGFIVILAVAVVVLLLKGFALYKAARLKQQGWFWIMLIFSTMGILPLIYLFINKDKKA